MRVKNLLKSMFAVMCVVTMALNLTACDGEEDRGDDLIIYTAGGLITGNDLSAVFAIAEYNDAIEVALGGNYTTVPKDKEVIAACDAVFQKHRTNNPSWKGEVKIEKEYINWMGDVVEGSTLKTYKYE